MNELEELKATLSSLSEFFIKHKFIEVHIAIKDLLYLVEDLPSIGETFTEEELQKIKERIEIWEKSKKSCIQNERKRLLK